MLNNNIDIFGNPMKDPKVVAAELIRTEKYIEQIENEIADIENNALYRGSFEWRFEFPEVLNEKGDFVGFDAIIGNPPYIRQEELGESKTLLKKDFPKTYAGTADLYVMFVEHGLRISRPKGQFVFIIPNKWMRAGYGVNLRKWLKTLAIEQIADFGDLPVFDEATTYPSILSICNAPASGRFQAALIDTLKFTDGLSAHIQASKFDISNESLQDEGWQLTNVAIKQLMAKLRASSKPLGDYVDGKIYYGIKTGLNEAFVLDAATKDRLILEDARSAEVIKPFLAGRDVKRYQTPRVDKYLILIERGQTNRQRNGLAPEVWLNFTYPAVYAWLKSFESKAKIRADKGDYWWELRACDYYKEFEKPKIIVPAIIKKPANLFDISGCYSNDKTTVVATDSKFVLGIMNCNVTDFVMQQISSTKQGGYFEYKPVYISQIPIPYAIDFRKKQIEKLVTEILTAKADDPTADSSTLEAEIDQLVYGLYGLTEEEIAMVEGR